MSSSYLKALGVLKPAHDLDCYRLNLTRGIHPSYINHVVFEGRRLGIHEAALESALAISCGDSKELSRLLLIHLDSLDSRKAITYLKLPEALL